MKLYKKHFVSCFLFVFGYAAAPQAGASLTYNNGHWSGTNYDDIVIDDSYDPDSRGIVNFAYVVNYGSISVSTGHNLDFYGSNYGTMHATNGLSIFAFENHGTVDGTNLSIIGSNINNYQTINVDSISGLGLLKNYGSLTASTSFNGIEVFNYGVAQFGALVGSPSFVNSATSTLTADSVAVFTLENHGIGAVTGSITAANLYNSGTLTADSLTMYSPYLSEFNLGGSLKTTRSVNLDFAAWPGNASIGGTLTAGEGVIVGSYTLDGSGTINGDVFVSEAGTLRLYNGLTINGTISGKAPILIAPVSPPIPEPETYATMLFGLGLVGEIVRRAKAT